ALALRLEHVAPDKRAILTRFQSFEASLGAVVAEAVTHTTSKRASLGIEWAHLRTAAVMRLYSAYGRHRGALRAAPLGDARPAVDFVAQKVAPLRLAVS